MILTLTANPALDRLIFLDQLSLGLPNRTNRMKDYVGGKGFDVSVALRQIGVDTLAVGFIAGDYGRALVRLLDGYGVRHDLTWVEGETRLAHVLAEAAHHRHTHVIVGSMPVRKTDCTDLWQRLRKQINQADWLVAAGSLPPGTPGNFYRQATEIARQAGKPILIDSSGSALREAFVAKPSVVKLNWEEFNQTFARQTQTLDELVEQAQRVVQEATLQSLMITCGKDGLFAFTEEGIYQAIPPAIQAVNAAGAGDAASGSTAWRRSLGDSWAQTVQWATAVSAASVLCEGTAECCMEDVLRLLPEVKVVKIQ